MRALLLAVGMVIGLTGGLRAQDEGIEAVISAQIEAFKSDDFAHAFSYASPTIRSLFGTPENFGTMVRNGYPMVWRPAKVDFFELGGRDSGIWQGVKITDAGGRVHLLAYQMIQTDAGWKINGVQIIEQGQLNA